MSSCIICMEDYSGTRVARLIPCGHSFCDPCLTAILRAPPPRCPTCRHELPNNRHANSFPRNFALEEAHSGRVVRLATGNGTRAKPRQAMSTAQLTEAMWALQVELDESRDALNWAKEQWAKEAAARRKAEEEARRLAEQARQQEAARLERQRQAEAQRLEAERALADSRARSMRSVGHIMYQVRRLLNDNWFWAHNLRRRLMNEGFWPPYNSEYPDSNAGIAEMVIDQARDNEGIVVWASCKGKGITLERDCGLFGIPNDADQCFGRCGRDCQSFLLR